MWNEFACLTKGSLIITGLRLNSECGCSLHAPLSLQGSEQLALVAITLHVCGTAIKRTIVNHPRELSIIGFIKKGEILFSFASRTWQLARYCVCLHS